MVKHPIQLGVIGRAKGIKGEFYVSGRDEPLPASLKYVWIGATPQASEKVEITSLKHHKSRPLLKLREFNDRTSIEKMTLSKIWAEKDQIPISDDEFFLDDLIGTSVIDCFGKKIGAVAATYNFGASDCLEIVQGKKTLNLPLVEDYFDLDSFGSGVLKAQQAAEFFSDFWE